MTMMTTPETTNENWKRVFHGFKMPHPKGKPDKLLPLAHRIAFLLDYAAKKAPYSFVPYNVVYKEINMLEQMPRMSNENVQILRKKLSTMRPLLQKIYRRDLKSLSGVGIRATVDDLDVVRSTTPNAVKRFNSAGAALKHNVSLVNAAKLPEGADKNWFARTVSPAIRALTTDERMAKLLPPAPTASPKSPKPPVGSDGGSESK